MNQYRPFPPKHYHTEEIPYISPDPEFRDALSKSPLGALFKTGYVYMAIRAGDLERERVKIGFTTNMKSRMRQLGTRCIFFAFASFAHEKALHRMFHEFHVGNEWFALPDDLLWKAASFLNPPPPNEAF